MFFSFSLDHRPLCLWSRQRSVGGRTLLGTDHENSDQMGWKSYIFILKLQLAVVKITFSRSFAKLKKSNQKLVEKKWELVLFLQICASTVSQWILFSSHTNNIGKKGDTNQLFITECVSECFDSIKLKQIKSQIIYISMKTEKKAGFFKWITNLLLIAMNCK